MDNFEEEKNTLSFEQKKCLIVLGLSVISKLPCILQGPTGIGKSHLIKLFAKILGKKLHIIVLNNDNDVSLLTKRNVIKKYDKSEENEINQVVDELLDNVDNIHNLSLKEKIKTLSQTKLKEKEKKKFDELKSKYEFIRRFKY